MTAAQQAKELGISRATFFRRKAEVEREKAEIAARQQTEASIVARMDRSERAYHRRMLRDGYELFQIGQVITYFPKVPRRAGPHAEGRPGSKEIPCPA